MKNKLKKKNNISIRKMRGVKETLLRQAVLEGLDVIDKDRVFSDAETRELFGLAPKKASVKAKLKQVYGWAESLSKKKGFTLLMEADLVRLVRESRDSLDTFEPCQ